MIDETTAELIHADIDGRLPEAGRAELSRILLADPQARGLHRDMQRLQRDLEALGTEQVPAGLADSVMAAIPGTTGAGRHAPARSWRYALALAAGIAVVTVVLRIGGLEGTAVDGTAAVGTMAPGGGASVPVALDGPEITGSVQLRRSAESLLVEVDVAAHHDVEVTAAQADVQASAAVRAGSGGVRQHLTLELPAGDAGPVSVRFTARGHLIEELRLDPAAGR